MRPIKPDNVALVVRKLGRLHSNPGTDFETLIPEGLSADSGH